MKNTEIVTLSPEEKRSWNELQRTFYDLLSRSFPALHDQFRIQKNLISEGDFVICIVAPSKDFGSLMLQVDNDEITVYTDFHHSHFETYIYPEITSTKDKYLKAGQEAIAWVSAIMRDKVIFEVEKSGDKILSVTAMNNEEDSYSSKTSSTVVFPSKGLFSKLTARKKRISWSGSVK